MCQQLAVAHSAEPTGAQVADSEIVKSDLPNVLADADAAAASSASLALCASSSRLLNLPDAGVGLAELVKLVDVTRAVR